MALAFAAGLAAGAFYVGWYAGWSASLHHVCGFDEARNISLCWEIVG